MFTAEEYEALSRGVDAWLDGLDPRDFRANDLSREGALLDRAARRLGFDPWAVPPHARPARCPAFLDGIAALMVVTGHE